MSWHDKFPHKYDELFKMHFLLSICIHFMYYYVICHIMWLIATYTSALTKSLVEPVKQWNVYQDQPCPTTSFVTLSGLTTIIKILTTNPCHLIISCSASLLKEGGVSSDVNIQVQLCQWVRSQNTYFNLRFIVKLTATWTEICCWNSPNWLTYWKSSCRFHV